MNDMNEKPLTIWIVEDNDDYRQVLADGLKMELGWKVQTFSSTEEALRIGKERPGGGAHYPPRH